MLNTTNPHCFVYEAGELLIELLGGVRVDTLDRMRVTMKVTVVNRKLGNEELAVRHNLDLYNDIQVEKFIYSSQGLLKPLKKRSVLRRVSRQRTLRCTHGRLTMPDKF